MSKIHRCYSCYLRKKYEAEINISSKFTNERVPRKIKKKLLKFYNSFYSYMSHSWLSGVELCHCSLGSFYENHKSMIKNLSFFLKHEDVIKHYFSDHEDGIFILDGCLSWYWEYDNGLYVNDGLMKFAYDEKSAGKTWAFSEVANLVYYAETEMMGKKLDSGLINEKEYDDFCDNERPFPSQIKNDISLIKYLADLNNKNL